MPKFADVVELGSDDINLIDKYVMETAEDKNKLYVIAGGEGSYLIQRGKIRSIDKDFSKVSNVIVLDESKGTYTVDDKGQLKEAEPLIAGMFFNETVISIDGLWVAVRKGKTNYRDAEALRYLEELGIGVLEPTKGVMSREDTETIAASHDVETIA